MPDMSCSSTAEDLAKLTVAQLKAICKEKKISAYSKLAKGAIIQKILEHARNGTGSSAQATSHTEGVSCQDTDTTMATLHRTPGNNPAPLSPSATARDVTLVHNDGVGQVAPHAPFSTMCSAVPIPLHRADVSADVSGRAVAKRKADMLPPDDGRMKQKKIANSSGSHTSKHSLLQPADSRSSVLIKQVTSPGGLQLLANDAPSRQHILVNPNSANCSRSELFASLGTPAAPVASSGTAQSEKSNAVVLPDTSVPVQSRRFKRFVPLVVKKANPNALQNKNNSPVAQTLGTTISSIPLRHLDFPLTSLPSLKPVTLPPSLSQRKKATRFAIALALVPPEDLRMLTRVSRLFRYAAYISAAHRLKRSFAGGRLADVMKRYSENAMNMWPYLQHREEERLTRLSTYQDSFLWRAMEGESPIADRMWTSPDNVKQATVVVRFLLTRLFFEVSVGHETDKTAMINDAQEVVEGEIWSVEIRSSKGKEILYVLEATCEVMGRPPAPAVLDRPDQTNAPIEALPLRADWSAYISQYLLASKRTRPPSLMDQLKWTNHEEYDRGISKLWLSRVQGEGEMGAAKLLVAERYILACVVGNGVSGRWMSSTEMEQEFNGLPPQIPRTRRDNTVHLFLPAHHHIESLHFTTSKRKPLHAALAVVQTPGREYYILKDNGMQVGCEETGVAEVWMQLLGCDSAGRDVLEE
ncbi:hypothetical protein LshimejAT787_0501200 [Lyophyllum shimeji]|uniref:Rho termination factor-like N-terminal domain-containing protein n=1 Tax=Lyophyllum shimeji TaxID=47721 RepID=A0A9P3PLS2_LYOSH|nr:hypothetical protein LshimejAT787_0501200 [Lyophyllum shimeji]